MDLSDTVSLAEYNYKKTLEEFFAGVHDVNTLSSLIEVHLPLTIIEK